jgi:putative ABC transport system permease protein
MLRALRLGFRQLAKSPAFALTAVLTLALGIGATTAIFTLVYDVLLKPLPYPQSDRLIAVEERVAEWQGQYPKLPVSANHFAFWQRNARNFEAMAAFDTSVWPLGTGSQPVQISVLRATSGVFPVLKAAPALGRIFTSSDDQPGHARVILLLDNLWRHQFAADPAIVGKTVTLNGFTYQVIGVMPASFHLPVIDTSLSRTSQATAPEAIVPMAFSSEALNAQMGEFNYLCLGRLREGVTAAEAHAELDALERRISASLSADDAGTLSSIVTPFQTLLIGGNRKPLTILLCAVAALLLVGCANIANLLLARAIGRRRDLAIAAALGAGRSAQLAAAMREIVPLATGGCLLGILLATGLIPFLQSYLPPTLNFRGPLHLDWAGAACAIAAAILSMLVAGAAPAWFSTRQSPQELLCSESRSASESRASKRLRAALVAAEVAASLALVLVAGLLTSSLIRLMHADRGFQSERAVAAKIRLPYHSYPTLQAHFAFYRQVIARAAQLPGVESAGMISCIPLAEDNWGDMVRLPGDTRPFTQLLGEQFRWISPGYAESMRLPLVAGRMLAPGDEGKNVALVSEATARTLWPGQNPVGRQFHRGDDAEFFTVIGVLGNARTVSLSRPDPMLVYVPYWYRTDTSGGLIVRTALPPSALADALRHAVGQIDATVVVSSVRPLVGIAADSAATERFEMDLLVFFAVAASLLAALGVYGVVSYSVAQREREIGLRIAVGASTGNILTLVLREGMQPVVVGVAGGVALALGAGRLLASLLYQTSPYSPPIALAAVATLLGLGAAACLPSVWRAIRIEPMRALRDQ